MSMNKNDNTILQNFFLLIGVFIFGFISLYFLDSYFEKTRNNLDNKSQNLENRIIIGEFIIDDVKQIRTLFSELATTTTSKHARELIKKDIINLIHTIENTLGILQNGGTLQREIKLNISGHANYIQIVEYNKIDLTSYSIEAIDVKPKLNDLSRMIVEANELISQKAYLKMEKKLEEKLQVERKIRRYYKELPSFFNRMTENIQRILYESRIELSYIKREIQKDKTMYSQLQILLYLLTISIILILGYVISRNINILNKKLYTNLEKQKEQKVHMTAILNSQKNIIVVTDGKVIVETNQIFFDFLQYKDLKSFLKEHDCICDFFIQNDKFFHLGKIKKNQNWAKEIMKLPKSQRIVTMMGNDFNVHAFSVDVNEFANNLLIISFTDITETIEINIKLEEKTITDNLTGAYNREFFEKNYRRLINEYHTTEHRLAIALFDIDHFKSVNDTFGHDIGDEVLIQFVKVIQKCSRKDDIFIRWGGEEFILILKVESKDGLEKALEHLRSNIERYSFSTVGQKTCSIGATIYKGGEDIHTTIKRADICVYEAKANGRNQVIIN